ncbi:hypothetical protein GGP41_000897 [Bipolaris sorokiniana]|uniref:Mediator complex subunit 15 KIX domain-containing protein n=1 Tax=Cochliobolus sativus TaxID=45130 RepID=A0A8H5ZQ22_COCSA|nr:hypothetical protein GGP41_000897 [Bipolaris sorokiniana]
MNNPNMQQNGMQQGRATAGIHHFVQHYRVQQQQGKIPTGWQQTTSPDERGQLALQFFTQYRLLKPDIPEVESMRAALQFETQNFMSAASKEQYLSQIKQKLIVMTTARQQQLQRLQGGMPNNMNNAMNGMTPAQMNMMNQMGQQGARQPQPQQFNPAFPNAQLQRPMQVSPVPMTQGQSSMGVNGANPVNMAQGQNAQQPNMQPNQQQTRQEQLIINQFAKKLMDTCKEEVRVKFENDVRAWPEDKKQQLLNQGINPLFLRFRQHAEMLYRRGALNQPAAGQNNVAMQGTPQQNRMQGQQMNMNQRQANQDFDFTEIANRQMEAMRSQDQGTTVVPASNNPNNGGQMGGFQGQNPQPGQAPNAMAQRQAEAFHRQAQAQQAQQAHAQAQVQARLEQQRQQQVAQAARNQQNQLLQGQIGGLNLSQGTQQPSPAMPMLNRPMPPPGQPGPPGTPQQRPPQAHVPIMTPQPGQTDPNLTELMRQAQQRAAAVQQANQQPLTDQVRMSMMPPDLDASVKQQLLKVPEHQFRRGPMPNQQQRVAAASNLLRANPGIIHTTDPKPFPPNVLNAQIRQSLPPDVRTWQQLKAWASQNPALVPGVDGQKLLMLQVLHFQDMVRQSNGVAGVHPTPQPGQGLVPPGQINPNQGPVRTPQQQPNIQNMAALQVTPQELQQFRARMVGQPQANLPDDQLRGLMISMRMKNLQQQRQQQQQSAMLNQQAQRNQAQPAVPMGAQQQPQHQPNRPPAAQPQTQATPQPKPAMKPQQAQPTQSLPNNNANNNNTVNKGTKRSHEDTMESGNETTPQALPMASSKSQPGLNLTQEQMSKLTPAQHAQYRAQLLKAQDASNNKMQQQRGGMLNSEELRQRMSDPARIRQFKQMMEEVEKSIPAKQPIALPPAARTALQKSLKEQFQRLKQSDQALRIFHASYDTNEPEPVIRQIMRSRALLFKQINEADGTLHPQVTLTIEEFKNHLSTIFKFVIKIQEKVKQQTQGQGPAAQQSQPQGSNASPAQLNAANLKIVEQQNRNQKAPSAPTTDRPPFAIGADPGHGAAHYFEGARPVTNLVLPEKKRAKLEAGSQSSTPAARASPHISSGNSPELRRQPAPDKQVPQRPTFRCNDTTCEYSVRGFDTQAELDLHSQIHAKVENPMQFALDSMAEYLDIDQKTGEAKTDPNASKSTPKAAPATLRAPPQNIKTEQTPGALQNAATPVGQTATASAMARVPTQTGIKDSPSSNLLKTPQTMTKVTTPGSGARGKATPVSIPKSVPKEQQVAASEPAAKEEEQQQQPLLPMSLLDCSYEDTFAALDANGPFTVLDLKDEDNAWALRSRPASPSTTPESSSKDTPSTRQSDISENDNLVISIDLKDADMPDAWAVGMYGDALPVDLQLSEDLQNLGVMLPPMDSEDMMLFPDYGNGTMMDLDMLEKTMDSMGGTLDAPIVGV